MCRPERVIELAERYVLFDGGDKKIARYQQYFCVRKILDRVRHRETDGSRRGGVVWHTQGSGKSLTMVMLAKGLALDLPREGADEFKIALVTDRVDLDDQIFGTFKNCGTQPVQATTGKHLSKLLSAHQSRIITSVIDKFETALQVGQKVENDNIFALVDESHRGQFGETHTRMRRVLPHACFIGFTGTPVTKKQKSTIGTFGGLIHSYTITEAVEDKAARQLDDIFGDVAVPRGRYEVSDFLCWARKFLGHGVISKGPFSPSLGQHCTGLRGSSRAAYKRLAA